MAKHGKRRGKKHKRSGGSVKAKLSKVIKTLHSVKRTC